MHRMSSEAAPLSAPESAHTVCARSLSLSLYDSRLSLIIAPRFSLVYRGIVYRSRPTKTGDFLPGDAREGALDVDLDRVEVGGLIRRV